MREILYVHILRKNELISPQRRALSERVPDQRPNLALKAAKISWSRNHQGETAQNFKLPH
jgi:hypothetical protein